MFLGIAYSIVLGLIMGVPTLRLRADYLAIVTIAAAEVVRLCVRSVKFSGVFGGTDGLQGFAGGFQQIGEDIGLQPGKNYGFWAFQFSGKDLWVLLVGWSLVALLRARRVVADEEPWGRVLKAIREDEDAVRSLGKNVFSYKMQALILGGVIGTFGGMILALGTANVQPDNYSRDLTFFVLTGARARRRREGQRLDRRADAVLGDLRLPEQLPAPSSSTSRGAWAAPRSWSRPTSAPSSSW